MDRLNFYRAFLVALFVVCVLLHMLICAAHEMATRYEDQHSVGIRYSKFLVLLRIAVALQAVFALEALFPSFSPQREIERIPDPQLRLLLKHFLTRFHERNVRIMTVVCISLLYAQWFREGGEGFVKGGMPFLVVFVALTICRIHSQKVHRL